MRETIKSNELTPSSARDIEISRTMIRLKDLMIKAVPLRLQEIINYTPLMLIGNAFKAIIILSSIRETGYGRNYSVTNVSSERVL